MRYRWLPIARLARDRFDSLGLAQKVTVPLFVFHCIEDPPIPYKPEQLLAAFSSTTKSFSPLPGICHVPSVETLLPRLKKLEAIV